MPPHDDSPSHDPTPRQPGDVEPLVLDTASGPLTFQCAPGGEAAVLERIAALTRDREAGIEPFSAARLADQIGRRLRDRVAELSRRSA